MRRCVLYERRYERRSPADQRVSPLGEPAIVARRRPEWRRPALDAGCRGPLRRTARRSVERSGGSALVASAALVRLALPVGGGLLLGMLLGFTLQPLYERMRARKISPLVASLTCALGASFALAALLVFLAHADPGARARVDRPRSVDAGCGWSGAQPRASLRAGARACPSVPATSWRHGRATRRRTSASSSRTSQRRRQTRRSAASSPSSS